MSLLSDIFLQPMSSWTGTATLRRRPPNSDPVPPRGEDPWSEDKQAVKSSLGYTESGNNYGVENEFGYIGKYQFGPERLSELGLGRDFTLDQFRKDSRIQEMVMDRHLMDLDKQFASYGLDKYEGQTIGGVPINRKALYSMAHLGGVGGTSDFLTSDGKHNPSDAYGTSLSKYGLTHGSNAARRFASRQALEASDIQTDLRNTKAEMADFEERGYTLSLTPGQKEAIASMEPFKPMGEPTIQSLRFDPYPMDDDYRLGIPEDPNRYQYTDTMFEDQVTPEDVIRISTQDGSGSELPPEVMDPASPYFDPSKLFSRLEALGLGLAQMSTGQTVDLSPVWNRRQKAAQFDDTMDQRQHEFEEAQKLRSATEARLQQQMAITSAQLMQSEKGRLMLAQNYVQNGGDPDIGAVIASSEDAAGAYIDQLFPSQGNRSDASRDYTTVEARDQMANVAIANGEPEAIVNAVRNNPSAAAQYAQTAMDTTADSRRANRVDMDAGVESLMGYAEWARTPEEQRYYRKAVADALAAQARNDPEAFTAVFDAAMKRTEAQGVAGGAAQAEADVVAGTARSTVEALRNAGASDATLAVAELDPMKALERFDAQQELRTEDALKVEEEANRERLAQDYDLLADNARTEEEAQQLRAAANHVRNGDSREAASIANQVLDKPNIVRQVEWAMSQPTSDKYVEVLKDFKRAETGSDLDTVKNRAIIDQQASELKVRRDELPQLRRSEEALKSADAIARNEDFSSGQLVNMFFPITKALKDIGFEASWTSGVQDQEVFKALSNSIVQFQRAAGSGHMSDWDAKTLQDSIFNLGMSEVGNRALIQYMRRSIALRRSDLDADSRLFIEGDYGNGNDKDRYRRENADKLGLHTEAFYALDKAGGDPFAAEADYGQTARELINNNLLKDGDIVMIQGKLVPFSMEAFERRFGNE